MGPKKKKPEDRSRVKMAIGKYADLFIDEVPSSYLRWVAENWSEETPFKQRLVEECDKEWQWREANNKHIDD